MPNINIPKFDIQDIPEFQRFKDANLGKKLDALNAIMMYGDAIHWISILDIIWPDFEKIDYKRIEVAYIITRDPDSDAVKPSFHKYVASMISMFWEMQLEKKYPKGDWEIIFSDDPEITLEVEIHKRE